MTVRVRNKYLSDGKITSEIRKMMWIGFVIRIAFLTVILTIGRSISDPYFITDDIKYEELARHYLNYAVSPIDINAFKAIGASGYLQVFWPWVMCVAAYLFRNVYAGRVINVLLSTFCIRQIYDVTYSLSEKHETALSAARWFTYLPITVMTCCFPIKDIFLTYSSLVFFKMILDIQNEVNIRLSRVVYCVLLLIGTYFTRGAVVELYSIFVFVYLFHRLYQKKKTGWMILLVAVGGLLVIYMGRTVIDSFTTKINVYGGYALENMGGIALVRMSSWRELYKLPLAYFFAMLQPIKMDLLSITIGKGFWLSLLSLFNVSIYPVAIGSFLYIFKKKNNFLFWLSTFVLYAAVISLSLGIFRHYLFLLPIEIINYSLVKQYKDRNTTLIIYVGSILLLLMILLYSLF